MLSVCCWKWRANSPGSPDFGPEYVNRLHLALQRNLHIDHELVCVTDDPGGIDPRVRIVPLPERHATTPRCRRRMRIFDRAFAEALGPRILSIDLDVVIVGDLTPIVARREPLVGWRVRHAGVYSGSFLLMDAGVLDGLWRAFDRDPVGFPARVQATSVPSDQAMLNWWIGRQYPQPIASWSERDGFVTYYGAGYERLEHLGVGPTRPTLPPGARIVVLGSADKAVMDDGRYPWVVDHWRDETPAEARAS